MALEMTVSVARIPRPCTAPEKPAAGVLLILRPRAALGLMEGTALEGALAVTSASAPVCTHGPASCTQAGGEASIPCSGTQAGGEASIPWSCFHAPCSSSYPKVGGEADACSPCSKCPSSAERPMLTGPVPVARAPVQRRPPARGESNLLQC